MDQDQEQERGHEEERYNEGIIALGQGGMLEIVPVPARTEGTVIRSAILQREAEQGGEPLEGRVMDDYERDRMRIRTVLGLERNVSLDPDLEAGA